MMRKIGRYLAALLIVMITASVMLEGCGALSFMKKDAATEDGGQKEESKEKDKGKSDKKKKKKKKDKGKVDEQETDAFDLYAEMSLWEYHFMSGAGGWETTVTVSPDGTFTGHYYDSEMGDEGPGYPDGTCYQCDFTGKFTGYTETEPYTYKLDVGPMEYKHEIDKEEIINDVRYIYAGPYGFDGLNDGSSDLYVYLPGRSTKGLTDEFWEWIGYQTFGTYLGSDLKYIEDIPDDLPFCALYNTCGRAFYSDNVSGKNRTYLKNRAKLPDMETSKKEINDDGTYICEDMDPYGGILITNTCFRLKEYVNPDTDPAKFAKACLDEIGMGYNDDPYVTDKEYSSMVLDKMAISGRECVNASWSQGKDADGRYCIGCFMGPYMRDFEDKEHFVYAYIISYSTESESTLLGELPSFYLGSVELTGRIDEIPSAGEHKGLDNKILTDTAYSTDPDNLKAEEVFWVTENDTDLIEKYHLDPNEFFDDYQIAGADGKYQDFPVDKDCIFYVQYPEDGFHKLLTREEFNNYVKRGGEDSSILMNLIRDKNGKVVVAWEPYTP